MSFSNPQEIKQLDRSLTNQAPKDDLIIDVFEDLRSPARYFGQRILAECPPSRERSLAITKLEEAVMWAIKAVALNQDVILEHWAREEAENEQAITEATDG